MPPAKTIVVKDQPIIIIIEVNKQDYISLTDMVRSFGDDAMIYSWMRNRNSVEFLGIWEKLYNPGFKGHEFVTFKMQAGLNNFIL
jgi:KilA-N domain